MNENIKEQLNEESPPASVTENDDALDITDFIEDQKKLGGRERKLKDFEYFGLRALIFVIVVWALLFFFIGFAAMDSNDMHPRVDLGDLMMFYRLDRSPSAQDVVVFEKGGERYVGRIVAIPGDTVEITSSDTLVINGSTMVESDIYFRTPRYDSDVEYPLTLGENEYFVLADNRLEGMDSRWLGPVTYKEISGTVIAVLRRNHI